MKIAPVSGDLLVKLALGAAALAGVYVVGKSLLDKLPSFPDFSGLRDALDRFTVPAGQVYRGLDLNFTQPIADRADPYALSVPDAGPAPPTVYGGKYANPLVNDDGMNFGLF